MITVVEKKESMPSGKVKREVEELLAKDLPSQEKLQYLLRLYRREQTVKSRGEANLKYLRDHILAVSGGSFEAIAASVFTQGFCTETVSYLQGEKAEAAKAKLEKLFGNLTKKEQKELFYIEQVPFLKMNWDQIKKRYPKLYAKARRVVGTYLQLTVRPLTKKLREGE